jgi:hypothetical protein
MAYKRINHYKYIFVLLIAILLSVFSTPVRGDVSFLQNSYGPPEKQVIVPVKYNYSQATDLQRAHFQGQFTRVPGAAPDEMFVDLKVGYGRFFSLLNNGYRGFGYFTADLDSDDRFCFNSSLGHFLPVVGGELFFTYRVVRSNLSIPMQNLGLIEDKVYENSFSANYSRFTNGFLREASFNYSFSSIPSQEFTGSVVNHEPNDSWHKTKIQGGFSDTMTHEIAAHVAFGSEKMAIDFLSGFKTSLDFGYEYVEHDAFHDQPGQILKSFSALATLEQQTSIGLIQTSYKRVESSRTFSAGYLFRGLELYFKNTRYKDLEDTQLYGFKINIDLNTLGLPFRKKTKSLFSKATNFYKGSKQIRHNASISSDHFTTQPIIRQAIHTW